MKFQEIKEKISFSFGVPYLFNVFVSLACSPTSLFCLGKLRVEVTRKYAWGEMEWKDAWMNTGDYFIDFGIPFFGEGGLYLSFRKTKLWAHE